jgi:hypothetical protein
MERIERITKLADTRIFAEANREIKGSSLFRVGNL